MHRAEHQLVGSANFCVEMCMIVTSTETGMDETDGRVVFERENQPRRIKVGLRKNELFEDASRYWLCDATLRRLVAPDFRDARRVGIAKRAELIHSDVAAGSEVPRSSDPLSYAAGGRGDKEKGRGGETSISPYATSRCGSASRFLRLLGSPFQRR
jgi:hypothetical protein